MTKPPNPVTRPPTKESLELAKLLGKHAADDYLDEIERGEVPPRPAIEQTITVSTHPSDAGEPVMRHRLVTLDRAPDKAKPVDAGKAEDENPKG